MYNTEIFGTNEENRREIHMGIDIGAPVGSPIYLFYPGKIFCAAIHSQQGNYGGTIITEHVITDVKIWALYGHLSRSSVERALGLKKLDAGETIGWIGNQIENGGWAPHLHFQLSVQGPPKCDMQGVVSLKDHQESLKTFLDPRIVLGNIY
ncbi:MAG: peptidoglycan DD-metalloendopeptidase family protein [Bdellovibrio sp.]|nr:peptidoglycan DD-metalloendopeptidase family protein [Bdellovibrio sp.]